MVAWNMAQLATALLQQLDDPGAAVEEATRIVHAMPGQIEAAWIRRMGAKLGIAAAGVSDLPLIEGLLKLMQEQQADFTNTFDALARGNARDQVLDREAFDRWAEGWKARIDGEVEPEAVMHAASPRVIPRNHRVEEMIAAAVAGDYGPFHRLLAACAHPFDTADTELMRPPTEAQRVPATFCGT